MIFIGYNCNKAPFVHYGVADKNGKVIRDVPIHKINAPIMMHDFAITEHYSLLFENSLVFDGAVSPLLLHGHGMALCWSSWVVHMLRLALHLS